MEKIYGSILDVALRKEYYDLALLSHILYYIPSNRWLDAIAYSYQAVKKNGSILIALGGDHFGKADLIQNFGGSPLDFDRLMKNCISTYGIENVQEYVSKEVIITSNLQTMLHIAGFLLYDAGGEASRDALADYINTHCQVSENRYELTTQQTFILIYKP